MEDMIDHEWNVVRYPPHRALDTFSFFQLTRHSSLTFKSFARHGLMIIDTVFSPRVPFDTDHVCIERQTCIEIPAGAAQASWGSFPAYEASPLGEILRACETIEQRCEKNTVAS